MKKLRYIWGSMKSRCNNLNHPDYATYGNKGICVSEKFEEFNQFLKWALANGYREGLSIDRINGLGHYTPDNCRWATIKQQTRNRKSNVKITLNGKTRLLCEWIELSPISKNTIVRRIYVYKWDIKRALTELPYSKKIVDLP